MKNALSVLRLVERTAVVAIFLVMVLLYFVNVVVRASGSGFASRLAWIEEAVRTMNLYLVFLAIGLALEYGRHVAVDTWRDRLAARLGLPVRRIIDAVGLVFCLYVVWLSWKMTVFVHSTNQISPTLGMQMYWLYVAPMVGFALLGLRYGLSLAGGIGRFDNQNSGDA